MATKDEVEEGVDAGAVEEAGDVALDGVGADAQVVAEDGVGGDALQSEGGDLGFAGREAAVVAQPGDVGCG